MELRMVESEIEALEHKFSLHNTPTRTHFDAFPVARPKPVRRMTNRELEEQIRETSETPRMRKEEVRSTTPSREERPSIRRPSPIRYEELSRPDVPRSNYLSPLSSGLSLPPKSPNPALNDSFTTSKAYTLAMKALQDRVQTLESENLKLQEVASVSDTKVYQEKNKLQQRFIEEIEAGKAKEIELGRKIEELQEALYSKNRLLAKLEDEAKAWEGKVRNREEEGRKRSERMEEETEQQSMQVEHVKKQLESRLSEIQTLQQLLSKSESDSRITEESLAQAQQMISTLQTELDFLRRNGQVQRSTLQKNLSHVETELGKQNGEYLQKMRTLEVKNKHLQDLADNQKAQLDYLKQEIVELQTMNRESEEARIALLQNRGESIEEHVSTTSKSTKMRGFKQKRGSSYEKTAKPSISRSEIPTSPHFPIAEIDSETKESASFGQGKTDEDNETRLEREISAYNQQYKSLLQRSQEPGADLASLRVELNSVATAMEAKSNHLYALKKQRSFSRDKPTFYV